MSENRGGETSPASEKPVVAAHGNERLTFFSDGVFAITITLLVLELKVPHIAGGPDVGAELADQLADLLPKFISHIMSFFVLGIYWVAHHNIYMYIIRHNHTLLWLNTLFLMCVASIPFPTALLGEYPDQQISVLAYAGVLIVTGIVLDLIWWYATTHNLVNEGTDKEFIAFVHTFNRIAPACYLGAIAVSFLNLNLAKLVFFAVAAFYILPNPLYLRHYKKMSKRFNE
ncbi:MAG: TMEM175 family protein [Oscillatoria sp. Prado101]|jgi:uncharacterized membrane protein|nr:TMEM175 family protein [Oscillatoria sp. Prado101]